MKHDLDPMTLVTLNQRLSGDSLMSEDRYYSINFLKIKKKFFYLFADLLIKGQYYHVNIAGSLS